MENFKLAIGNVNIFPLDILYAASVFISIAFILSTLSNSVKITNNIKSVSLTIAILIIFFTGKLIIGYFDNTPLVTLIRYYARDTQLLYFFIPFIVFKKIDQFIPLLKYTILLCLLFPLFQPLLINSADTQFILKGQGTFRLGHGDANILLAIGVTALFCWEKRLSLAFLPLSGVFLLAHRSAFIGIFIALISQSVLRGKKKKTIILIAITGFFVLAMLIALSTLTDINILDRTIERAGETFKTTGTTKGRFNAIEIAFNEFKLRPMTGLSYKDTFELQQTATSEGGLNRTFTILHPHNFVLASFINTGLIGTSLLFYLITKTLLMSYKFSKIHNYNQIGAFFFSYSTFFIIFSIMNTTMETVGSIFWFFMGTTFWFINHYILNERNK